MRIKFTKCQQCPNAIYRKLDNCDIDFYECYKAGRPINPETISKYCPLDSFEITRVEQYLNQCPKKKTCLYTNDCTRLSWIDCIYKEAK